MTIPFSTRRRVASMFLLTLTTLALAGCVMEPEPQSSSGVPPPDPRVKMRISDPSGLEVRVDNEKVPSPSPCDVLLQPYSTASVELRIHDALLKEWGASDDEVAALSKLKRHSLSGFIYLRGEARIQMKPRAIISALLTRSEIDLSDSSGRWRMIVSPDGVSSNDARLPMRR